MYMGGYTVYNDGFLVFAFDDPRNISEDLIAPWFLQQILSALNRKNVLNVNLRICSCHNLQSYHPFGVVDFV